MQCSLLAQLLRAADSSLGLIKGTGFFSSLAMPQNQPAPFPLHSRNVRAAPQFSPTRSFDEAQDKFISLGATSALSPRLDCLQALRDKTLYVSPKGLI